VTVLTKILLTDLVFFLTLAVAMLWGLEGAEDEHPIPFSIVLLGLLVSLLMLPVLAIVRIWL
jgi:hypothetical protein